MKTMISMLEAQDIILAHTAVGEVNVLPLQSTLGAVLAAPVRAHVDVPSFDNSAMDGFALDHHVTQEASNDNPVVLPIVGYQPAGVVHFGSLKPGCALRVSTGAMVPLDATAVVPIEDVEELGKDLILRKPVKDAAHIRRRGEETRSGELVLDAGVSVSAAVGGYLASIGVTELPVYRRPRIGIVATGTELMPLGARLGPGQIYDSNSIALSAAMHVDGVSARVYPPVDDDFELQKKAFSKMISENDVVVATGGVSVGNHDYVKEIMMQLEIEPLFWKVRQKPGKPLYVGCRPGLMFFGLPGNPASSLINYYEYVRPALRKMMGHIQCRLPSINAVCKTDVWVESERTQFFRSRLDCLNGEWQVAPLDMQGSHCMKSFAQCNSLLVIPEAISIIRAGSLAQVHVLPHGW
ncbi:MAG: molybdopterin molybdenumtransferase MoeA [Deltaproteobacteria bacterium CG11_big_fil_rev_8_21_14_0_20_47_16]|nr:MAG: molybdopterin molybdenumtransferase MoeA [Deltaproteobacteria bacterium CG11_big_fil_rev_8_21_14_0_20_47_16]